MAKAVWYLGSLYLKPLQLFVWHDQCEFGLQYFNIGFIKTRLMISDRDQQIRMLFLTQQFKMLFLTQHVELAKSRMRPTRDRTCQTEFALLPECTGNTRSHVLEQGTVLFRVRDETRDRTCQNRRSYFSEYAMRHEIARVRTGDRTSQSTR